MAVVEGPLDGLRSYHLAARGVDEQRLAAERLEEAVVGQVIGAVGPFVYQGDVEGDDVALLGQLLQRAEAPEAFTLLAWGVVEQHAHTPSFGYLGHQGTYMAYTHDAQRSLTEVETLLFFQKEEDALQVLRHGGGITARHVSPRNARLAAVGCIDMVKADGSRSDKLHAASLQQLAVAAGAGTYNQGIGVAHHLV